MNNELEKIMAAKSSHVEKDMDDLSLVERLKLAMFFGSSAQGEFIRSFMEIKQSGVTPLADLLVIKKMKKHIEQAASLTSAEDIVCAKLEERLEAGFAFYEAMNGLFKIQFTILFKSMSAAGNVTSAVNRATTDASEVFKSQSMNKVKLFVGFGFILIALVAGHFGGYFYADQKLQYPKGFRFLEEPDITFAISHFAIDNLFVICIAIITFLYFQNKFLNNYTGEYRTSIDKYYPPAVLHRREVSISMFSAISLLVKDAGIPIQSALMMLEEFSPKYECMHYQKMLSNIGAGEDGTMQLSTGLLTKKLDLRLKLSGEGEGATIKNALNIIAVSGKDDLITGLKATGSIMMFSCVFVGFYIIAKVGLSMYDAIAAIGS